MADMGLGWLTRIVLGKWARRDRTAADRRDRLIKEGRRNPEFTITPEVVALPTEASGQFAPLVRPKILILQLAHIGDFVLSFRALKKLADGFPGSEFTLVCAPWNVEWAKKAGLFVDVIGFDFFPRLNRDWNGAKPELFERFEALPLGSFNIAVDLRHDEDTRPCLFRVNAGVRAGFQSHVEAGRPYLDLMLPPIERVPLSDGSEYSLHAELRLELLADAVVNAYGRRSGRHPASVLASPASAWGGSRSYVVLALSAGDSIRRWPAHRFAEIAREIIAEGRFSVVLAGGAVETPIIEDILSGLPVGRATAAVDVPLPALAELVSRSSLVIGLGTGVTHLSAALGIPTVVILSGVSPLQVWRPVGPRVVALTGQTPCSPCWLKDEAQCPFGVVCLHAVTTRHVVNAAAALLGSPPSHSSETEPKSAMAASSPQASP